MNRVRWKALTLTCCNHPPRRCVSIDVAKVEESHSESQRRYSATFKHRGFQTEVPSVPLAAPSSNREKLSTADKKQPTLQHLYACSSSIVSDRLPRPSLQSTLTSGKWPWVGTCHNHLRHLEHHTGAGFNTTQSLNTWHTNAGARSILELRRLPRLSCTSQHLQLVRRFSGSR